MKISASEVRIGNLLEYQGKLYRVLRKDHVKPGKGGAFVQLELKENDGGSKLNERFRSEDKVEKARVEPRQMEYLYSDETDYVFMDLESYEQIHLNSQSFNIKSEYLLPNQEVQVNFYNDQPIGMEIPSVVTLTVSETEVAIKGQTASGSGKPATLETGLRVIVPTFVESGDKIRVNTETDEYIERTD
tara:strand:- start:1896 stop:2459 length:564 start_codon:yes stop_codon:yes gene_type:complete